jgi:error-prone DNA polymerase
MTPYVELHCHSHWSLLDGASSVEELVLRARELGYEALALNDHDGLYGAMEFAQTANAFGVRPIIGAEVTLADGYHLTLLCETQEGYANLCRLLSHAHLNSPRSQPALHPAVLARHARGLIALSGCKKGEVPSLVAAGRYKEAEAAARRYIRIFGRDGFFIELQQNLVYGDTPRIRALVNLAKRLSPSTGSGQGVGYVATNNVHYHLRERHRLQDVLVAIRNRTTLDASHTLRRENSEYYLKSPQEMAHLFAEWPEALETSVRIAERCTPSAGSGQGFDLTRDLDYRFPDYPAPKAHPPMAEVPEAETADSYLEKLCYQAAGERYGRITPEVEARLQEELALVGKHGLSGFFLIYRDLLELARQVAEEVRGKDSARARAGLPPGRGRGSSVGSLICYLIGLSHIDPLQHKLFLGRFLNEEMTSVPDIDLDFPREIREELILQVYARFGPEHAALVCSFPTYRIRSAVRDVGKALGLAEAELDKLAKRCEGGPARDLAEEMARLPEFRDKLDAPVWRDLMALARQIDGFPRHVSQHVGGMIISSRPLVELVPVMPAAIPGRVICQWDKDSVDDAGFIKIDFLALGMLSLVEECVELIAEHHGRYVDLSRVDFTDPAVYDMICAGDTVGVFQVESRAQMQMLPRTQPRSIEDLTVEVAIVRPGPIVGKAVNPYAQRRQGREPVTYDHPSLEPVLEETLGVILYQEQVLQVAMALAGFTAGQAEALRRAMSRKRSREAMEGFWREFRIGALENGVDEKTARRVFDKLLGFAEFGFPKSHAAAFALLAYQSAWLKRYYPAEFYCALFNAQPMGFYPPHVLTKDAQRHGIEVLSPDVNRSGAGCTVEEGAVRIGFAYVQGIGEDAARALGEERRRNGPFRSLSDFVRRVRLKREPIENLIQVGAFDQFGLNRRELLWQLGLLYRPSNGQLALPLPVEQDMVPLPKMTDWERMAADYSILALSPQYHPMALMRPHLHEGIVSTAHLERLPDGTQVEVAGLVVCRQRPMTAKGFVFMLLEDEFGMANVVIKPQLYERYRSLVRAEPFVLVRGELQRRDGTTNLIAENLRTMAIRRALAAPRAHNFA